MADRLISTQKVKGINGSLDPIVAGVLGSRALRFGAAIFIGGLGIAVGIDVIGEGHCARATAHVRNGIIHSSSVTGLAGVAGDGDGAGSGLDGEVVAAASKAIIAGSQRLNIDRARTDIGVVLMLRDLVILCAFSSAPRHLQLCTAYCREFFPLCLYPKV